VAVRIERLVARGFRNLAPLDCEIPPWGVAVLGANGQGKTNLLEAVYYPVLFRSVRGAPDADVARFGGLGFHVEAHVGCAAAAGTAANGAVRVVATTCRMQPRRKRIAVDGAETDRAADAVGAWLAVAFLPEDVGLAIGPGAARRQYLDRLLSLADRRYLLALTRYRAALAQRNSALRKGRPELAQAFDAPLGAAGAEVVAARGRWAAAAAEGFAAELAGLGEPGSARLRYVGREELADPAAWPAALADALPADRARGLTTVGPHRDDLALEIDGRPVRGFGSTGQQRSAAVALKLLEIATLAAAHETEPALLLDDVFAELDRERQDRLAARLRGAPRQVVVTAPRADELPPGLELPVWEVVGGRVEVRG
jgi:DNA replication and repair protein RecF